MNDTLMVQFENIIKPRVERLNQSAGREVARLFEDKMKSNSLAGRGFGNDQFDSTYSRSHRSERRIRGLQTSRVTLRMEDRRIEDTVVETTGEGAVISHSSGGRILKYHHTGDATGGKTRSIWPKSPESIPETMKLSIKEVIARVLRGEK